MDGKKVSQIGATNEGVAFLRKLAGRSEESGAKRDEEIRNLGYRYVIVQNYIIFYTIEQRTIFIHRILHDARNYKSLL